MEFCLIKGCCSLEPTPISGELRYHRISLTHINTSRETCSNVHWDGSDTLTYTMRCTPPNVLVSRRRARRETKEDVGSSGPLYSCELAWGNREVCLCGQSVNISTRSTWYTHAVGFCSFDGLRQVPKGRLISSSREFAKRIHG